MAHSTAEAESVSAAMVLKELLGVDNLLCEIGVTAKMPMRAI